MSQLTNSHSFYLVHALDAPGKGALREELTDTHREYMGKYTQKILIGGPLMDDSGTKRIGSSFIIQADSRNEVEELLQYEPYYVGGLFESVTIRLFRKAMFNPTVVE